MERDDRTAEVTRFGVFEVDLRSGELHKDGRKVHIQEQPFRILAMLLERCGSVVTRDELREKLWANCTFVDFDHAINAAVKRIRHALKDDAENPRFVETLPRRGYRFIAPMVKVSVADGRDRVMRSDTPIAGAVNSVVVLPLENLSRQTDQDYFADGITAALITNLGKIRTLRVISRTTAMHFKGTNRTLPEIARELNVAAVVEGSVMRYGNRVRVTANLLDAQTDRQLWAGSYESELRDVLALQGEVARAIAEEVRIELTPADCAELTSARPVNSAAYEAYLRGNYALKRSAGGLVAGINYFRASVVKDPSYAPAYVGLALLHIQMALGYGPLSPSEALEEARRAALQALRFDATLAEAISCLAWVKTFGERHWTGGELEFRCAVERSPGSPDAHRLYAWYLSGMGRHDEAIAHSRRAHELDPTSLLAGYALAAAFWWARRYEHAIAEADKLEQMDPTFPGSHRIAAGACFMSNRYEEAIGHLQREAALSGGGLAPWSAAHLGYVYAVAGRSAEARQLLERLESASGKGYVSPYLLALLHTSLRDHDDAFQWLDKADAERNPMLGFLKVDPLFDPLRTDARFQNLLDRMNFPR